MIRLAMFDCDGTLVDSGATIHRALQTALETHGFECPPHHVAKKVIGLSLEEAMAALVPDGDHVALSQTYKEIFFGMRGAGDVDEPLYDGIVALLDELERDGWLLGIATGKSERGLRHVLETHHLDRRFITLQTADNHPSKPHPSMLLAAMAATGTEPRRTVYVGDTGWDMGAAVNAGVGAIGAGWGYHDHDELREAGAEIVADAPGEVAVLARRLTEER